jgi:SAM-dependent methyltransferase
VVNSPNVPLPERRRLLWKLYCFNARISLNRLIRGLDFSRCFEYLLAYESLLHKQDGRLLDIGSYWSTFPLFMASQGFQVLATDVETAVFQQKKWHASLKQINGFEIALTDATRLAPKESSFDAISAISTIEHIPTDGDIRAMAEFKRVIKPGGLVFISVPYTQVYREGTWESLFQRYYDSASLEKRLIAPSGLRVKQRGYILGENSRQFASPLYKLPGKIQRALGWSHMVFALYYLSRDKATAENADIAWLLLERPD